jgi:thiamine kinase-like enzyme
MTHTFDSGGFFTFLLALAHGGPCAKNEIFTFLLLERRTRSESRNEMKSPPPFEQIKKLEEDTARLHTFVHDLEKKLKLKHLLRENEDLKSMIKVSKFQKQIFLFSFEPKNRTKSFFDFCPKDLKWVK